MLGVTGIVLAKFICSWADKFFLGMVRNVALYFKGIESMVIQRGTGRFLHGDKRVALWALWLWAMLSLTACLQASPASGSRDASALRAWFPDPQAQALAVAAEKGDAAEVRRLMKDEGVDPDRIFGAGAAEGMPLLVWPILMESPAGLKAMLESGANPNASKPHPMQHTNRFKGRNDDNAMVYAVKLKDTVYLNILLDHGGDPDTKNSNGETLAFIANSRWDKERVKLLIDRGANVNIEAGLGMTLIEKYALFGNAEMMNWLLEQGADPSLTIYKGNPIHSKNSKTIQVIFWYPTKPLALQHQRKNQLWLLAKGYSRPPMPAYIKKLRLECGYPAEEDDVPLVLPEQYPPDWPPQDHLCQPLTQQQMNALEAEKK